jgi:hypothetical protein
VLYAVQERSIRLCLPARRLMRRGDRSQASMQSRQEIGRSIRICSVLWRSEWAQRRSR